MFEGRVGGFRNQAERNLDAREELIEQVRKGQEAAGALGRESVRSYADFLDSLFFREESC